MSDLSTIGTLLAMSGIMTAASVATIAEHEVGILFLVEARDGGKEDFEAGYKRHLEWHRRNKDTWPWPAWEIITGERAGLYLEGTFGHEWPGLDRRLKPAGDAADHRKNVDPYVSRHERQMLVRQGVVSRGRPLEDAAPAPFLQIVTFELKPGTEQGFEGVLAAMHRSAATAGWHDTFAWYARVDGGTLPTYLLVIPLNSLGALAPSENSVPDLLARDANRSESKRYLDTYRECVVSVRSELVRFRPDLSYLPNSG